MHLPQTLPWGQSNIGGDCSERLYGLHPRRFSRSNRTMPWKTCSDGFERDAASKTSLDLFRLGLLYNSVVFTVSRKRFNSKSKNVLWVAATSKHRLLIKNCISWPYSCTEMSSQIKTSRNRCLYKLCTSISSYFSGAWRATQNAGSKLSWSGCRWTALQAPLPIDPISTG